MSTTSFGGRMAPRLGFVPAIAFIGVFSLLPAIATVVLSFTNISATPGLPTSWVGLANYRDFLGPGLGGEAGRAVVNTLIFAVAVSAIQNVLAVLVAMLLNRRSRFAVVTRSVVFLPSVLGVTVVGLIWTLFFSPVGGPAENVLRLFGTSSSFFGDPSLALGLCIFVQIWMTLGYAALIYTAGLQSIPAELYEAAEIDGAGRFARTWRITLPLLAPSITTNLLISIVGSLQAYQLIFVLTGVSNSATDVLSLMLYRIGFGLGPTHLQDQGLASAVAVVQFVIVAVIALVAFAILRRRETQL